MNTYHTSITRQFPQYLSSAKHSVKQYAQHQLDQTFSMVKTVRPFVRQQKPANSPISLTIARLISAKNGKHNLITGEWLPISLYHAYTRAMVACMAGKRHNGRGLSIARLNRALMLIVTGQAQAKISAYRTTMRGCWCEDFGMGAFVCKHQLAAMLLKRAGEVK